MPGGIEVPSRSRRTGEACDPVRLLLRCGNLLVRRLFRRCEKCMVEQMYPRHKGLKEHEAEGCDAEDL